MQGCVNGGRWEYLKVWESAHGEIPIGSFVRRVCSNPRCKNLEHMKLEESLNWSASGGSGFDEGSATWRRSTRGGK